MDVLFLVGRVLFSALFLLSGVGHFTQTEQMVQHTKAAGVPAPKLAVLGTGVLLLLGGLSILLGFYPTIGLILLLVFLVPTTFLMHRFWEMTDPMQRQMQMINFNKNIALIGAALMLLLLRNWPLSLGGW
uniref:DoxX family protein n=1 Tax=Acetithermum autotrophicum TaxID=1446466 RepID=H5SVS1_ACEAU|nr:DoxX family protein [Candidatus Acetothermum autotrophicum]